MYVCVHMYVCIFGDELVVGAPKIEGLYIFICMYVCVCICMYVDHFWCASVLHRRQCIPTSAHTHTYLANGPFLIAQKKIFEDWYMYICMYVCMSVCVCVYVCEHT